MVDRWLGSGLQPWCIRAAGTAPSGANLQPWHFVAIGDPAIKRGIRVAAEAEEKEFYEHRAPKAWLEALGPTVGSGKPGPLFKRMHALFQEHKAQVLHRGKVAA